MEQIHICKKCNYENINANYCTRCGNKLYVDEEHNLYNKLKLILLGINLKDNLIISFISVIITNIMNILFFGQGIYKSLITSILYSGVNITLEKNVYAVNEYISMSISVIAVILIQIICIFIVNKIYRKVKGIKFSLGDIAISGIIYSFISMLIVNAIIMNSRYVDINIMKEYYISNYYVFDFIVRNTIIYFMASILSIPNSSKNNIVNIIKNIVMVFLINILLMSVVVVFARQFTPIVTNDIGLTYKYDNFLMYILQIAFYFIGFSNLIPITMGEEYISILSLFGQSIFIETKIILVIVILINVMVLLLLGVYIKHKGYKFDYIKRYSMIYSCILGVMALSSNIYIENNVVNSYLNNMYSLRFGYNLIVSLIIGYLYSYFMLKLGYRLNNIDEEDIIE